MVLVYQPEQRCECRWRWPVTWQDECHPGLGCRPRPPLSGTRPCRASWWPPEGGRDTVCKSTNCCGVGSQISKRPHLVDTVNSCVLTFVFSSQNNLVRLLSSALTHHMTESESPLSKKNKKTKHYSNSTFVQSKQNSGDCLPVRLSRLLLPW